MVWEEFLKIPTKPKDVLFLLQFFNRGKLYFKKQLFKILHEKFEILYLLFHRIFWAVSHITQPALFASLQARQDEGNCYYVKLIENKKFAQSFFPLVFAFLCVGEKEEDTVFPFSGFPLHPFHLIFVFDYLSTASLLPDFYPLPTWYCIIIMEGRLPLIHTFLSFNLARCPYQTAALKNKEIYYFENNSYKYFVY